MKWIIPYLQSYYSLKADRMQLGWDFNKQSQLLSDYSNQLDRIQSAKTYKIWQFYNRFVKRKIFKMVM